MRTEPELRSWGAHPPRVLLDAPRVQLPAYETDTETREISMRRMLSARARKTAPEAGALPINFGVRVEQWLDGVDPSPPALLATARQPRTPIDIASRSFRCDGLACRAVVRSACEKLCVTARLRSTSTRQPSFFTTKRLACRVEARSAAVILSADSPPSLPLRRGSLRPPLRSERRLVGPLGLEPRIRRL